jgi:hypothetical protein
MVTQTHPHMLERQPDQWDRLEPGMKELLPRCARKLLGCSFGYHGNLHPECRHVNHPQGQASLSERSNQSESSIYEFHRAYFIL